MKNTIKRKTLNIGECCLGGTLLLKYESNLKNCYRVWVTEYKTKNAIEHRDFNSINELNLWLEMEITTSYYATQASDFFRGL